MRATRSLWWVQIHRSPSLGTAQGPVGEVTAAAAFVQTGPGAVLPLEARSRCVGGEQGPER